jgi:N6-L-threonylcarbamoyladenine synthase
MKFIISTMICLGIESTAHTFGIGIVNDNKVLANARDIYVPRSGGIHPIEAKNHHVSVSEAVLEKALSDANISLKDVEVFSYSAGPGLPPCLLAGAEFVKKIAGKKPIIATNHCIAHIEIGKLLCEANDPITLYVSGGNTQVIGYAENKYRIFGETQDIGIGNAIDKFIREVNGVFPGGPVMQKMAQESNHKYIELPYVVKGMDLSFSGIVTSAIQKYNKNKDELNNLCYSFQETCYAMLTEVTERALAHTGKKEVLLTGGVAASQRLQEMLRIMCNERDAVLYVCPREFAGDNGAMIAYTGLLAYKNKKRAVKTVDFRQRWRTDEVDVTWMK